MDFTKGHAQDLSPQGNHGTLMNGNGFTKTEYGWGYYDTEGTITALNRTSYISVPDDDSLDLTALSITVRMDAYTTDNMGLMVGKRDAFSFGLGFPGYFDTFIVFQTGVGTPQYSILSKSAFPAGTRTIGVIQEAGSSTPKFYADGVYVGDGNAAVTITTSAYNLHVGNVGNSSPNVAVDTPMQSIRIRNEVLTEAEMLEEHTELLKRKTPFRQKENFHYGNLDFSPSKGSYWIGKEQSGYINDQGNIARATVYNSAPHTEGITGLDGVRAESGTWYGDCGVAAEHDYTTETFGGWALVRGNGASLEQIMGKGVFGVDGYFLRRISNTFDFVVSQSGGSQVATADMTINDDLVYLVGYVSVAGDKNYIYINGEDRTTSAPTRVDPDPATGKNLYLGRYYYNQGARNYSGDMFAWRLSEYDDLADFEQEYKRVWNQLANRVIYKQDFSDAYEHYATYAPGPLPGTDWQVSSVSGQVKVDDDGSKYITSPSAGNVLKRPGTGHTFGRLEFEVTPTSGTRARHSFSGSGTFAILDVGDSGNGRIAYTTSTGGVVFATANGTGTTDKQTIRIDKKANVATNNTSIYKDGELLTAATGSNPCTDITNFTVERQLTSYSNAKIHSITHYFGVPLD